MNKVYIEKTLHLANEIASKLTLTIEDVEWVKEAGEFVLRIIADSKEGLTIDQATELNNLISERLDVENFIQEEYMLEVSSPGIERVLKTDEDIVNNINSYVHIDFINPFEIMKNVFLKDIEGTLLSYENNEFELNVNLKGRIKKVKIEKENTKLIRKAIKF